MCTEHICFSCRNEKTCKGNEFDPMRGPVVGCENYWPKGWVGILLAPFLIIWFLILKKESGLDKRSK